MCGPPVVLEIIAVALYSADDDLHVDRILFRAQFVK